MKFKRKKGYPSKSICYLCRTIKRKLNQTTVLDIFMWKVPQRKQSSDGINKKDGICNFFFDFP